MVADGAGARQGVYLRRNATADCQLAGAHSQIKVAWATNAVRRKLQRWQRHNKLVDLRIEERITRCKATSANPETGRIDADTLGGLEAAFGHQDFGLYAVVTRGGAIATGDKVTLT